MKKPREIFVISDTHWNHKNIVKHAGRHKYYDVTIMKNWRKIVGENDMIIHLGDVIFSRAGDLGDMLNNLPGKKILVRGNHDRRKNNWYMDKGFDFVCDEFVTNGVLFSHEPRDVRDRDLKNIHGHFHSCTHRSKKDYDFYCDKNLNVSIEKNFSPVKLDSILSQRYIEK